MTAASCVYTGRVRHRRWRPVEHRFRYSLFQLYLDLSELDTVFRRHWLWSTSRPAPAWFRRSDHLGDPELPLDEAARDLVEERTGWRPRGPIRLLTHLRYFGYVMNPVSFFYCYDQDGDRVECVIAEIHNTPWGERHCYVLSRNGRRSLRFDFDKEFHISPFMDMDLQYGWHFTEPGDDLHVAMEVHQQGERLFDAQLRLRRRPISSRSLAWVLLRYPWMTAQVVAGIYWQAFRLHRKRVPFHPHPKHAENPTRCLTP